jgi:hypothetical protein
VHKGCQEHWKDQQHHPQELLDPKERNHDGLEEVQGDDDLPENLKQQQRQQRQRRRQRQQQRLKVLGLLGVVLMGL